MTNKKDDEFAILSDHEYVLKRPTIYIGSINRDTFDVFINGKRKSLTYCPGLMKIINEVIDNSVDEGIRTGFKFANKIDVSVKKDYIKVTDNGRGIPQDLIIQKETGKKILRPVAAWTLLKASSNFNKVAGTNGSKTGGSNGVGSSLTNLFSSQFIGETCDGKNIVTVDCANNCETVIVNAKPTRSKPYTTVEFKPEFSRFGEENLDPVYEELIKERLRSLSVAFPKIKFTYNKTTKFSNKPEDFIKHYGKNVFTGSNKDKSILYGLTQNGSNTFDQNSFVTNIHTLNGGSHVNVFINSLLDELVPLIEKTIKIKNINKNVVKNHLTLVLFVTDFEDPTFDNQMKVNLDTPRYTMVKHYQDNGIDFKKIAGSIRGTEFFNDLCDTLTKRLGEEELQEVQKKQKAKKTVLIENHVKASKKGGQLFLVEGLSAKGFFINTHLPHQGCFPLTGKVLNTLEASPSAIAKNKVLSDIMAIFGLTIGKPLSHLDEGKNYYIIPLKNGEKVVANENDEVYYDNSWKGIEFFKNPDKTGSDKYEPDPLLIRRKLDPSVHYYSEVAIMTDADYDGIGSIYPLLILFFSHWKELLDEHRILFCRTPLIVATKGKQTKLVYEYKEYKDNLSDFKGWKIRYNKGLGTLSKKEYGMCIQDPIYDVVVLDDPDMIKLVYGSKNADDRKEWIQNSLE